MFFRKSIYILLNICIFLKLKLFLNINHFSLITNILYNCLLIQSYTTIYMRKRKKYYGTNNNLKYFNFKYILVLPKEGLPSAGGLNINIFVHYCREWRFYYYYSPAYHFTAAFRITLDWFNIGTAMRSRCKDARKNISQKAARKEKGASAKSAYHGHDCFGLKSTTFFVAFFFTVAVIIIFNLSDYIRGARMYNARV